MSSPVKNQQPKTPRRTPRQGNRTVSGSEQNQARRGGGGGGGGGRRSARGAANPTTRQQTQQKPEWDAAPASESQGDFDANGTFVLGSSNNNNNNNNNNNSTARPESAKKPKSSRKSSHQSQHEAASIAPTPPLPFPTLGNTPHKPYAGPTFHSSPAASALPMPKFFSKSVPNIPATNKTMQARVEHDAAAAAAADAAKDSESSVTPEDSPSMPQAQAVNNSHNNHIRSHTDSPLDLFFTADRAEKAKQKIQSPPVNQAPRPNTVQVPQAAPSHWASIYGATRPQHTRNYSADSSKGLFTMELDGANGKTNNRPNGHMTPPRDASMASRAVTDPTTLRNVANAYHNNGSPVNLHNNGVYSAPNHIICTPVLPSEMDASNIRSPEYSQHNQHQHATTSPAPRSAGSSPFQTPPPSRNSQQSPHHYGNRNLSPMFHAARNTTPRTQSYLRQELASRSPTGPANELPGSMPTAFASHAGPSTDMAARNFLTNMIGRGSPAATPPAHAPSPGYGTPSHSQYAGFDSIPQTDPVYAAPNPAQGMSMMEGDLRRMLKISKS